LDNFTPNRRDVLHLFDQVTIARIIILPLGGRIGLGVHSIPNWLSMSFY
jgi:hypothetical protein